MATSNDTTAGKSPASSATFWAESAAGAKAWAAVATGFFGVIALAVLVVVQHSQRRAMEINGQLAQNAARLGQEVELKYKNYRVVVDNVTRMMSAAGAAAADSRRKMLKAAEDARVHAQDREREISTRLEEVKTRKQDAIALENAVAAQANAASASDAALGRAYETAEGAADAAISLEQERNPNFQQKAGALVDAQAALEKQAHDLEVLQQALDTARQPAPASAPPSDSASGCPSAPEAAVAAANLRATEAAYSEAQNRVERERADFVDAQQQLESAVDDADRSSASARAAFVAWHAAAMHDEGAKKQRSNASKRVADASAEGRKSTANAALQHTVIEKQEGARKSAAEPSDSEAPNDYLNSLVNVVLPSQRALVDKCRAKAADVSAVKLCVAQEIAQVSNEVEGLEMVACTSDSMVPSITDDGRYLIIPPTQAFATAPSSPSACQSSNASKSCLLPVLPPACGRVKVRRFLAGSDPASSSSMAGTGDGAFDGVFLLRRDGTTLHSLNLGSNLRLAALPGFQPRFADASQMLSKVDLGTGKYRAFLQPVRIRLATLNKDASGGAFGSREHADLVVCGLALEDRLEKASYELSLPSYLWAVLLLGLGLLSLPLAKLWLLGPKTAFTGFDVTALATSAMLLTLLGAVVVLGFVAHNRLDARADQQITQVGQDLAKRLASEIGSAATTLSSFNQDKLPAQVRDMLVDGPEGVVLPEQTTACAASGGALTGEIVFADDQRNRSVCERTNFLPEQHANWSLFFMLDKDGDQRVKFVPGRYASSPVSLKDREYFKRAIKNDVGCVSLTKDRCVSWGVPELVRSVTSGSIVLIVAQPVCSGAEPCQPADEPIGVSAIETPMKAFEDLAFPLGVQAAVIDEAGRIMLHSNNDAHHEQSLFGEVGDAAELRAALATHVPETIQLNYLGQPSHIHLEPLRLPGGGWSVATIVPTSIVDVATTDMVLATLFGYGILIGSSVLLACCVMVARQARDWLWRQDLTAYEHDHDHGLSLRPRASHSRAYARLGLFAIRAGTALSAIAIMTAPAVPTAVGVIAAVFICFLVARQIPHAGSVPDTLESEEPGDVPTNAPDAGSKKQPTPWSDFLPLTYLLCIVGLAQVFVMAPASVLFAGAYDYVVDDLLRAEHDHYATVFRHHPGCVASVREASERNAEPTQMCSEVFWSGEEQVTDHASSGVAWQALRWRWLSPLPYLADLLPRVGSADSESSGRLYQDETIGEPTPSPTHYASIREPLTMRFTEADNLAGPTLMSTPIPPLLLGTRYHGVNFIALVLASGAALATTYVVGFYSLRRLFFLDVLWNWRKRKPKRVEDLLREFTSPSRVRRCNILLYYASDVVREQLKSANGAHELNLTRTSYESELDSAPGDFWLIDELEASLGDGDAGSRLIEVSKWSRPVVVLANCDPMRSAPKDLQRTWARALERFEVTELQAAALNSVGVEADNRDAPADPTAAAAIMRAWLDSDQDQQRLLGQVAVNGYVTPHPANETSLKALAARGLLDPETMMIADSGLKRYARQAISTEDQAAWAEADRGTAWMALRVPLSTGVAALLAGVAVAKPELGVASAIVPTLTAGLPTVLKILTQMIAPKSP